MDNLDTKASPTNVSDEPGERFAALQRQNTLLLVGLVVLSGTLSVFLWRQSHYSRIDLDAAKTQVLPQVQNYKQNIKPQIDKLEAQLGEYARTHADFAQLLGMYRVQLPGAPTATAAPSTVTPVPAKSAPAASTSAPPAAPVKSAPVKK